VKIDKPSEDSAIAVFVPGLPDTPGWLALSRKKQDALLQHTSHIQQHRQLQMLGEFGELMELYQVQQLLEGEEMKMADYLRRIYPDRHQRTIDRKREVFAQLAASIPTSVLKRLTAIGTDVLGRFDRIAHAALGDIRNAVKELPQLTAGNDKDAEKYLEALDTKLLEHRQAKRKGKALQMEEEVAAKMATNGVLHYMRACGKTLKTSAQKRHWLSRVMGWVMEAQGVSGTLHGHRIPIPDGLIIRRGRPRKKPAGKEE
jgi:hypothetical protein